MVFLQFSFGLPVDLLWTLCLRIRPPRHDPHTRSRVQFARNERRSRSLEHLTLNHHLLAIRAGPASWGSWS